MTERVYLPATLTDLALPGALHLTEGYAVTRALRAELPDEDEEGLEYEAYRAAVAASLTHLAAATNAPLRRLVVSADFDGIEEVDDPADPAAVRLAGSVQELQIACYHVDDVDAIPLVAEALAGNAEAIGELGEIELMWYDATERDLLAKAAPAPPT